MDEPTTAESISSFVKRNKIAMAYSYVSFNPGMEGSENMDNYKCIFRRSGKRMTVYFSKGMGHNGAPPEIVEVLDCVASDAAGVVNSRSLAAFCAEYGYSEDSRRTKKIYRNIQRQEKKLRDFLGQDECEALLWSTERL